MMIANYENVLNLARQLELKDQLLLLRDLINEISSEVTDSNGKHSIMELKGLGSEIWTDIDVEEYLQKERSSWAG